MRSQRTLSHNGGCRRLSSARASRAASPPALSSMSTPSSMVPQFRSTGSGPETGQCTLQRPSRRVQRCVVVAVWRKSSNLFSSMTARLKAHRKCSASGTRRPEVFCIPRVQRKKKTTCDWNHGGSDGAAGSYSVAPMPRSAPFFPETSSTRRKAQSFLSAWWRGWLAYQ